MSESITVPLDKGFFAIIDAADGPKVMAHRWYAKQNEAGRWYAATTLIIDGKRRTVRLHQFILDVSIGRDIDHENLDGLDCRRSNLREATRRQNVANTGLRSSNTSGFKGVSFRADRKSSGFRWRAGIRIGGITISLGQFATADEAGRAYDDAARKHFGEFARLNFPREGERGVND